MTPILSPSSHRSKRVALTAVLLGACLLTGRPAAAAPATAHPQAPLAQSLQGTAKEAYESARLLFKEGDFSGAANKYQQAYDLSKDPRLLFDIAICAKNQRAYARMQALLERYRSEAGADMSGDDRAAVDGALAAVKNLVGTLTLSVDVPGLAVLVDGQPAGTTPLASHLVLDLGAHVLTVQGDGLKTVTRDVSVVGGADAALTVTMERQDTAGELVVAADPDAVIVVDGAVVGTARYDGRLAAGPHELRVTAPGKQAYHADVDLKVGETRSLTVSLTSEAHAPIWPWIVGGAVVVAGAVIGGYFLFKPGDTTVPVPAGAAGQVQFTSWRFR